MKEPVYVGKPWERTVPWGLGVATAGKLLYTSGITARDPAGNVIGAGDMRVQIEQAFKNLSDVLSAAGCGFDDVVKYTVYTTDVDAFLRESEVWRRYFVNRPASTLVEVRRLVDPKMLVEIEAVVEIGEASQ